jgi:hypothetical protein
VHFAEQTIASESDVVESCVSDVTNHGDATRFSKDIVNLLKLSPLNSVPKKDLVDRQVISDFSFPPGYATNLLKAKSRGCLMYKWDLKIACCQISTDPGDLHLVGFCWKDHIFLDRLLSMVFRSSTHV